VVEKYPEFVFTYRTVLSTRSIQCCESELGYCIPQCNDLYWTALGNTNTLNSAKAPWSTVLLEKLVKKFPAFYETQSTISVFTTSHHLSVSRSRSIQSSHSNPTSRIFILILSIHPSTPRSSKWSFLSGFLTKTLYTPLPIRATCPAHLIIYLIARIIFGEGYRSRSPLLCNVLQSPVTSSLLGPKIFLGALLKYSRLKTSLSTHLVKWQSAVVYCMYWPVSGPTLPFYPC
jgi:hypothetical protein